MNSSNDTAFRQGFHSAEASVCGADAQFDLAFEFSSACQVDHPATAHQPPGGDCPAAPANEGSPCDTTRQPEPKAEAQTSPAEAPQPPTQEPASPPPVAPPPLPAGAKAAGPAAETPERAAETIGDQPIGNQSAEASSTDHQAASEPPTNAAETAFKPAWEVERFNWPPVCQQVLQTAATALSRCAAELATAGEHGKIVGVFAAGHQVGATTAAICLAKAAAATGARVALVDANFDRPEIAKQLCVRVEHGWEQAVGGAAPLGECVIYSQQDRLAVVPAASAAESQFTAAAEAAKGRLRELAGHYDLVLVDCGSPADQLSALLSPGSEAPFASAILVHRQSGQSAQQAPQAADVLRRAGVPLLGVAETFASATEALADDVILPHAVQTPTAADLAAV